MKFSGHLHPLSHAEKRVYLTQQMHPQSCMWNLPYLLRFQQPPDETLFEAAVRRVIAANEGLRLRFVEINGEVRQYIEQQPQAVFDHLDFRNRPDGSLEAWLRQAARTPLPLHGGNLFRFAFIRLPGDATAFFFVLHHIIADGGSCKLFMEKLLATYQNLRPPPAENAAGPAAGYLDFVDRESEYLASDQLVADREYWNGCFRDLPDPIDLTGRTGGADLSIERITRPLPPALTDKLNAYCRAHNTSPFRVILAALYAVLLRHTRREDLVIGTATLNRYPEIHRDTIGMFVSSAPVRLQAGYQSTFAELLQAIREIMHALRRHDRYPYDTLIADIRSRLHETPEFMDFTLVQFMRPAVDGCEVEFICPGESLHTLTLYLDYGTPGTRGNAIAFMADYRADRLSAERTAALLEHIECLLEAALAAPGRKLADLEMLSPTERRRIIVDFNQTRSAFPDHATVHGLFEQQVRRTPGNTALVYRGRTLSYDQLNRKSNQLCRVLIEKGVQPGAFIGVLAERCLEVIIAQLAILKAGAAIMPIDVKYPAERVTFMLHDGAAPVLLTHARLAQAMALPRGIRVIHLDDSGLFTGPDHDLPPAADADGLFALLYTSGSTGIPKGVMLEHRSMVNFFMWFIDVNRMTANDRVAKHTSFGFDVSNAEIYPALLCGAALHIIPEDMRLSLTHLNEYYEHNDIKIAFFTTQLGEQFMELADNRSLRVLHVAGEKLRLFKRRSYALLNGYGPTECTIYATYFMVDRDYPNIPIGRPLPNYSIFILDAHGNPQPIGAPGELCVSGVALARGYLNQPEKTAEVFTPNPCVPGERMYRTGDLACWMPDGNILHLGRIDRQVKLRGFRIELGEIEQAMLAHPGCKEAAVIDRRDTDGRVYLCAYWTAAQGIDSAALRADLAQRLPEFMIPAHFTRLDAMPVNPNGKIDRKRLPEPDRRAAAPKTFLPPESPMEQRLATVWREILKQDKIGADDDFFLIGGDSLKAVMLQIKIEKQCGVRLPLGDLFKHSTLRELARRVDMHDGAEGQRRDIPRARVRKHYPVTSAQRQLFILDMLKNLGVTYHIPMRLELHGPLDRRRLATTLQTMLDRHAILRTAFKLAGGQPVQMPADRVHLKLAFQEIQPAQLPAVQSDFIQPFDLAKPPLMRVKLLALGPRRHVLLLDVHHIVFDGLSIGIFLAELSAAYNGKSLPAPSLQFTDFACWQNDPANARRTDRQAAYWHEALADPPAMEFPTDRPRRPGPDFAGADYAFHMDRHDFKRLRAVLIGRKPTLHHLLLGALHVLVARYTGQDDIVTGTSTNGRFAPGTEDIPGMFVNTLPVRTRPAGDKRFGAYLDEIMQTMLAIDANQEYPIEKLYESLNINRGAGRHPLFDFNFVLQNMERSEFQSAGLRSDLSILETGTAKFDFSLTAFEDQGALRFNIEYRRNLFDQRTISRIAGHYLQILRAIPAAPDRAIGDIEMLATDEKRFLVETINATDTPVPPYATVCAAFEQHAARTPDRTAVVAGDFRINYGELNRGANRIAHRLAADGIPRGAVCAVITERTHHAVLGMLAAMKAGCAYVGIDPGYPAERIAFILNDTRAACVLGRRTVGLTLPDGMPLVDPDDPGLAPGDPGNPSAAPAPHDLAYIIFTSGSTGLPKGVAIEHHSMVNFIHWYVHAHAITGAGRCAEFASFSFDVSVVQTFAPLTAGAELHIIGEQLRLSPADLNRYFERHKITHAHFPTQFGEQFMKSTDNRTLHALVLGGDQLRHYRLGHYRLVNEYGPSETTMASTSFRVDRRMDSVPIGRPVANTRVYVLDHRGRIQPIGVPGELHIAGAGVARGYFNRPELTAEKFLPSPFVPGERMYRTGDLVRMLPDGNLAFVGRLDYQVKIRGYRVEIGEIEKRLAQWPEIRECLVMARVDPAGDKYLCAYITAATALSADDCKNRLAREMPAYMVPNAFVQLDKMPLNRNGKIDRKSLPEPARAPDADAAGQKPRTPRESLIFAAWTRVLGFEKFGIHDNFFNIGGDSLKVIALLVELQPHLAVTAADLFQYATVAEQAAHLPALTESLSSRIGRLKRLTRQPDPLRRPQVRQALAAYRRHVRATAALDMRRRRKYRAILLTGATGTLGNYLLRDLLRLTTARIYAIVRGDNRRQAAARLRRKMRAVFGARLPAAFNARVTVLCGDLSADRLGLQPRAYSELAQTVDGIIHAAADTRHMGDYAVFYRANVRSTINLLQLARTATPKAMHHVSTTSVGSGRVARRAAVFFSEFDSDIGQTSEHVYIRSKMEAEAAVLAARASGLTANIYRAGNITVDSANGNYQPNIDDNAFFQQLKAHIQLGAVPDAGDERNISFVDQTSRAILALFDRPAVANRTFHIENPHRMHVADLLTAPELNLRVQKMRFAEFIDYMGEHAAHPGFKDSVERLMLHMGWTDFLERGPSTVFVRPTAWTEAVLAAAGFQWPCGNVGHMQKIIARALRERMDTMAGVPAFAGLPARDLELLARRMAPGYAGRETVLLWEGEPNDCLRILLQGAVEISKRAADGWSGVIQIAGKGALLGVENVTGRAAAGVSAETLQPASMLCLPVQELRAMLKTRPALAMAVIDELRVKLDRTERLVLAMS